MNTRRHLPADTPALEARLGSRLAAVLSCAAAQVHPDVDQRLRFAREQALARARARLAVVPARATWAQGQTLSLGGEPAWWQRALAFVPLAVLVGGLMLVQHASQREQVLAAAEVDMVLLGDTLPPAAYSDPGFAEFLHGTEP